MQYVAVENNFTMPKAIERVAQRGIEINTVINVGASDGRWSENCIMHYPQANYLLIEAQQAHEKGLLAFKARYPKASYVIAAAGNKQGEIYFDNSDL
ncbi:MAG: hypothetical protein OHK0057_37410 [Thermoflexibacter sp.]